MNKATMLARKMVCEWGMSEKLGPLTFGKPEGEIFLGREMGVHRNYSEKTAQDIDHEIRNIVEEQHSRALGIVGKNVKKLEKLAEALIKLETLDAQQVDELLGLSKPKKDKKKQAKTTAPGKKKPVKSASKG